MDHYDRDEESAAQRLDRNWEELLQELRVSQTGVQILTGFLLTLPVQPSFHDLSDFERASYVVAISSSIIATCLLISPVAMHRALFRRRRKETLVEAGHSTAKFGLGFLALAMVGVLCLVFSIVFGQAWGVAIGLVGTLLFLAFWLVLPVLVRRRIAQPEPDPGESGPTAEKAPDRHPC